VTTATKTKNVTETKIKPVYGLEATLENIAALVAEGLSYTQTRAIIKTWEDFYIALAKYYKVNLEDMCRIIFGTRGNNDNRNGSFLGDAYSASDGRTESEIIVHLELLREFPPIQTFYTVAHEMAHYLNFKQGIKDTAKSGRHNLKFKEMAEKLGLVCTQDDKLGWTTQGSAETDAIIDSLEVDWSIFELVRKQQVAKVRKPSNKLTWECAPDCLIESPNTGKLTRFTLVAAYIDGTCNQCGTKYTPVDQEA
jgi:hypothetical protein